MPVQCNICLLDDTDTEWCVLNTCGHVFHTVCLQQELEYRSRCPNCRVDIPKGRANSQPFRKVFFDLSEEPGGSQRGGSGGSSGGGDKVDVSAGQLQMKLVVKEQQLQQLKIETKESAERIKQLQDELQLAQKTVRKLEEKNNRRIAELQQLGREAKAAQNEIANLRVELNVAQTVATRAKLAMDANLGGDALDQALKRLVDQDITVPAWFAGMLEVRNKQLSAQTNKAQRLEREKEQAEGHLRHAEHEKQKLREQIAKLKQELEQRQQLQAGGTAHLGRHGASSSGSGLLPGSSGAGRALGGALGRATALNDGFFGGMGDFDGGYIPAPRFCTTGAGSSKPSLRQRMQRLTGKASGQPPGAAAVGSAAPGAASSGGGAFGVAQPSLAAQQQQVAGGPAEVPGADRLDPGTAGACVDDPGGDFVFLEGSEEQPGGLGLGGGDTGGAQMAEGPDEDHPPDPGCYSEVESEDEFDIVEDTQGSGEAQQQQQQQQQQQWGPGDAGGGSAAAASPPRGGASPGAPLLGKRRSPECPDPCAEQHRRQPAGAPSWQHAGLEGGGVVGAASSVAPKTLQPSNRLGYNPLPLKAGPSRLGAGPGAGPSFLRDPHRATTGLDDQARFIHRGPDGKGGLVSVYKAGGESRAERLQQAAKAQAGGGSKKQKSKAAAKGGPANGGFTIDLFFNRAS